MPITGYQNNKDYSNLGSPIKRFSFPQTGSDV